MVKSLVMSLVKPPFYKLVDYLLNTNFFRESVHRATRDLFNQQAPDLVNAFEMPAPPQDYRLGMNETVTLSSQPAIFITARFRSGSTFLWHIFRQIDGITAFYEPLNENRWFLRSANERSIDPTHFAVEDYCREYCGMQDLDRLYQEAWCSKYLYMDAKSYDPKLFQFITELLNRAPNRPVLQFNRMDFRLAWLKAYFPNTKIIHLYRHPREQWLSILKCEAIDVPLNWSRSIQKELPLLYTYQWARDLRHVFPFLDPESAQHPYALHYYLWRLSYAFGRQYADYSVGYEQLVDTFDDVLRCLFDGLDISADVEWLHKLNRGHRSLGYHDYAPESWYEDIENDCESVLKCFSPPTRSSPSEIFQNSELLPKGAR